MIHGMSHVTLPFAICCVRHRYKSQDIHRWETLHISIYFFFLKTIISFCLLFNIIIFYLYLKKLTPYYFFWYRSKYKVGLFNKTVHCSYALRFFFLIFNNYKCFNDPSAGSPTETLLRLLLPLDDKAHWTFQITTLQS